MEIPFRELQHCNTATASAESELASALPSAYSVGNANAATASAESELASALPSEASLPPERSIVRRIGKRRYDLCHAWHKW